MGRFSELRLWRARNKKNDGSRNYKNAERFSPEISVGLSGAQVTQRGEENLVNIKPINRAKAYPRIIFENVFSFCNIVTLFLMLLLICIGAADYALSSSIIIISMVIGIVQEIKAKQSVEKLSLTVESSCAVIRDGVKKEISTKELVLDDVYIVEAGAQVPVDSVIAEGYVEVDESILTGESVPVKRTVGESIYAGSIVMEGQAVARADRVGKDCYIESIARAARKVERPKSRIFNSINNFIKVATVILAVLAVILTISERLAAQMDDWNSWKQTIITVSSSIIGMIPVGMFVMMSTALAVSVLRLSKHSALPQDLYSVEMLARVNVLCLDKTGTITDGRMRVSDCVILNTVGEYSLNDIMGSMLSSLDDNNQTSIALYNHFGHNDVLSPIAKIPFSSKRKLSAVTFDDVGTFVMGAPEFVLKPMPAKVDRIVKQYATMGLRVIVLAHSPAGIKCLAWKRVEQNQNYANCIVGCTYSAEGIAPFDIPALLAEECIPVTDTRGRQVDIRPRIYAVERQGERLVFTLGCGENNLRPDLFCAYLCQRYGGRAVNIIKTAATVSGGQFV